MIYYSNSYGYPFDWNHSYQDLYSKYQQLASNYNQAVELR